MKIYEITIQTVILEEDNKEDAENTFLSMMEEGCLEYEIKEEDPKSWGGALNRIQSSPQANLIHDPQIVDLNQKKPPKLIKVWRVILCPRR